MQGKTRQEKNQLIKKAGAVVAEIYPKMFGKKVQLIPRAKETLEHISKKGIKIGLVTSTPRQNLRVRQHSLVDAGIEDLLEVVIAAGMNTVTVLTGFDLRDALMKEDPDAVIDSIADLEGILA